MPDAEFLLLGHALWLEFVNTAEAVGRPDRLVDAAAYLRWTKAVRVEAPTAASAFDETRRFRDQLLTLARALDGSGRPAPTAIAAINGRLAALEGREQLVRIGGSWRIRFALLRPPTALEAIARSAAETLANPLAIVRECANPECGLYLMDDSPNQNRRWCSPVRCGHRGRIERRRGTRPTPVVADG
jgi:predicted RNA-binding Zn ribbon-like protein